MIKRIMNSQLILQIRSQKIIILRKILMSQPQSMRYKMNSKIVVQIKTPKIPHNLQMSQLLKFKLKTKNLKRLIKKTQQSRQVYLKHKILLKHMILQKHKILMPQ